MLLTPIFVSKNLLTDETNVLSINGHLPVPFPVMLFSSVLRWAYFQGKPNLNLALTHTPQVIEQMSALHKHNHTPIHRYTATPVFNYFTLRRRICCSWCYVISRFSVKWHTPPHSVIILSLYSSVKTFLIYTLLDFPYRKGPKARGHCYSLTPDIALPTTGSRLIGFRSYFFEPIVVMQSLAIAGVASLLVATQHYGRYIKRVCIPASLFPTSLYYIRSFDSTSFHLLAPVPHTSTPHPTHPPPPQPRAWTKRHIN